MPNTLAHIGLQVPLGRAVSRQVDVRWLFLACILSDVPWIMQRLARPLLAVEHWPALRFYCTAQASLFITLFLAGALACLARRGKQVLGILALGCVAHLLMDALEIKWGNGVVLMAPVSWATWSLDLVWPESVPVLTLTAVPVLLVVVMRREIARPRPGVWSWRRPAALLAPICLLLYLGLPLLGMNRVVVGGLDAAALAGPPAALAGRAVAFDRDDWEPDTGTLTVFTGRRVPLRGGVELPDTPRQISVRGVLAADGSLQVSAVHDHGRGGRDLASLVGLAMVALVWLLPALPARPTGPAAVEETRSA